jgi:hypothetical protein
VWGRNGRDFLRSLDATGMGEIVQQAILKAVTGRELFRGPRHKQLEWKTFGGFAQAMKDARTRVQVLSEEAYTALNQHLDSLRR